MSDSASTIIYTIGHSDRAVNDLIGLLGRHGIFRLVDVRSQPYSRWVPQFNRENLARALHESGVEYLHMGESLGGRPADPALYGTTGEGERPDYERVAATPSFEEAVTSLIALASEQSTVVMCSEGDHRHCHRSLLLAPALRARGARVLHILVGGEIAEEVDKPRQLSLL